MAAALTLYQSTVGKKVMMALTGLIGIGFVVAHMIGNMKVFLGEAAFDEYAEFLRTVGEPALPYGTLLWIIRLVLLGAVALHVSAAYQLTQQSLAGRPMRYVFKRRNVQASYASRTMRWGGVILLLFVIYHLLHMTFGALHPSFISGKAYHNFVVGFQLWPVTLFYVLAMAALAAHVYHGFWSMFQTLGLNNVHFTRLLHGLAALAALVLFFGFISGPVAVTLGYLG